MWSAGSGGLEVLGRGLGPPRPSRAPIPGTSVRDAAGALGLCFWVPCAVLKLNGSCTRALEASRGAKPRDGLWPLGRAVPELPVGISMAAESGSLPPGALQALVTPGVDGPPLGKLRQTLEDRRVLGSPGLRVTVPEDPGLCGDSVRACARGSPAVPADTGALTLLENLVVSGGRAAGRSIGGRPVIHPISR